MEEIAYRDTWGKGTDSFIAMIYERLTIMRDLLAADGSIFVHCDWRVTAYFRLALDEIFGRERFCNELIWWYTNKLPTGGVIFDRQHDSVLWTTKGESHYFQDIPIPIPLDEQQPQARTRKVGGKREYIRDAEGGIVYELVTEKLAPDVWKLPLIHPIGDKELETALKPKSSKVVVRQGQIIKIVEDKDGNVTREPLTTKWSDWIDYWSVDFNFESKREIIRKLVESPVANAPGSAQPTTSPSSEPEASAPGVPTSAPGALEYEEVWDRRLRL